MRPQAGAPTAPTHMGGRWEAGGLTRPCVTCAKHELALEGLTQALARLRRGVAALREENAELRAELAGLQQRRSAAHDDLRSAI